jgi:hypothetical protein
MRGACGGNFVRGKNTTVTPDTRSTATNEDGEERTRLDSRSIEKKKKKKKKKQQNCKTKKKKKRENESETRSPPRTSP